MQQTVAGVTLRRSLGFWVGQLGDVPIMARKYNRGLYRWSVQRYQRSELLGKGVTLTEALQAARDWLAKQSVNAVPQ